LESADGGQRLQRFSYQRWRLFFSAYLPHPGMIVSRAQYERLGLYDTTYRIAADHDFILRATRQMPAQRIPIPMTIMRTDGMSAANLDRTFDEFARVTVQHGMPRPMAWLACRLKLSYIGMRGGRHA
jgi:hypothetical protein